MMTFPLLYGKIKFMFQTTNQARFDPAPSFQFPRYGRWCARTLGESSLEVTGRDEIFTFRAW
jgi:hypothetical protein